MLRASTNNHHASPIPGTTPLSTAMLRSAVSSAEREPDARETSSTRSLGPCFAINPKRDQEV